MTTSSLPDSLTKLAIDQLTERIGELAPDAAEQLSSAEVAELSISINLKFSLVNGRLLLKDKLSFAKKFEATGEGFLDLPGFDFPRRAA